MYLDDRHDMYLDERHELSRVTQERKLINKYR